MDKPPLHEGFEVFSFSNPNHESQSDQLDRLDLRGKLKALTGKEVGPDIFFEEVPLQDPTGHSQYIYRDMVFSQQGIDILAAGMDSPAKFRLGHADFFEPGFNERPHVGKVAFHDFAFWVV